MTSLTAKHEPPNRKSRTVLLAVGAAVVAAVIVVVVAASGGSTGADGTPIAEPPEAAASGPPAPTTEFAFFDGSSGSLASYAGRPLVVNFWASWCPSCVAELTAAFVPVQERFGDDVAFLGLNIQDERSKALALVEETGALFDLAEDPQGILYTELGGLGMPFTVLVSADGEVLGQHNGPLTEGQLTDLLTENFGV